MARDLTASVDNVVDSVVASFGKTATGTYSKYPEHFGISSRMSTANVFGSTVKMPEKNQEFTHFLVGPRTLFGNFFRNN